MSMPKFFEFFEGFLKALQDGEIHSAKDVQKSVIEDMHLTQADLSEVLPSGTQLKFVNRINWARTYLNKAGLIKTTTRGNYRITEEGKRPWPQVRKSICNTLISLRHLESFMAVLCLKLIPVLK